jgi:hypothetical protein
MPRLRRGWLDQIEAAQCDGAAVAQAGAGGPRGCAASHANSVRGAARKAAGAAWRKFDGATVATGAGGKAFASACNEQYRQVAGRDKASSSLRLGAAPCTVTARPAGATVVQMSDHGPTSDDRRPCARVGMQAATSNRPMVSQVLAILERRPQCMEEF